MLQSKTLQLVPFVPTTSRGAQENQGQSLVHILSRIFFAIFYLPPGETWRFFLCGKNFRFGHLYPARGAPGRLVIWSAVRTIFAQTSGVWTYRHAIIYADAAGVVRGPHSKLGRHLDAATALIRSRCLSRAVKKKFVITVKVFWAPRKGGRRSRRSINVRQASWGRRRDRVSVVREIIFMKGHTPHVISVRA